MNDAERFVLVLIVGNCKLQTVFFFFLIEAVSAFTAPVLFVLLAYACKEGA